MQKPRSLFWIGGGPIFRSLSDRLTPDIELLTLTLSPHSLASLDPPFRMEAIADLLSAKIRHSGIPGPYLVGGWSLEALMAYETARRLEEDGSPVELAILLDPPNLGMGPTPPLRKVVQRIRRELFHLARLRHMSLPEARSYMVGRFDWLKVRMRRRKWTTSQPPTSGNNSALRGWEETLWLAATTYLATPWNGRVCLLQAQHQSADPSWNPSTAWPRLVTKLEVSVIPGDHTTVFEHPNVTALAEGIQASVSKLTRRQGSL